MYTVLAEPKRKVKGNVFAGTEKTGRGVRLTAGKAASTDFSRAFPSPCGRRGTKNMLIYLGEPRDAAEDAQTDLQRCCPANWRPTASCSTNSWTICRCCWSSFTNNPGTLKRIRQFLQEAVPALREAGLSQVYYCAQCGKAFEGAPEIDLVDGTPCPSMPTAGGFCAGDRRGRTRGARTAAPGERRSPARRLHSQGVLGAFSARSSAPSPGCSSTCSATSPPSAAYSSAWRGVRLQKAFRRRGAAAWSAPWSSRP